MVADEDLPYQWAWEVTAGDGKPFDDRHDKINNLFYYDYDQNRQFEFMYQKHLTDVNKRGLNDGAEIAKLCADINKVSSGARYLGYCLSDKEAKTTNLIVSGKDTRYL
jgi:hypothetical protein